MESAKDPTAGGPAANRGKQQKGRSVKDGSLLATAAAPMTLGQMRRRVASY